MQEEYLTFKPIAFVGENDNILIDLREDRMFAQPMLQTLTKSQLQTLKDEITKPTITIAKYAQKYKIPNDKLDKTIRDDDFEYFKVEHGMNINVPEGKLKKLRFYLSIYGDGKQSRDVFALDGFPNDEIKHVTLVSGKIKLYINKLLKIIPYTAPVSDILEIDLNPWEFNWGYNKLIRGFSEGLTDNLDWYLAPDNVNQSFQFYIILKKRKIIKEVTAVAKAAWVYEPPKSILDKIRELLKLKEGDIWIMSDEKTIQIIP